MAKMLKITQVKSVINSLYDKHRPVMEALGFKKNYHTLYKKDTLTGFTAIKLIFISLIRR